MIKTCDGIFYMGLSLVPRLMSSSKKPGYEATWDCHVYIFWDKYKLREEHFCLIMVACMYGTEDPLSFFPRMMRWW